MDRTAARVVLLVPGLAAALCIAFVATATGKYLPLAGAPITAILIGLIARAFIAPPELCVPGLRFAARSVLQAAIIVSGFAVTLQSVVHTGITTLPVTLATISVALILAQSIGRLLRLDFGLQALIGIGTAICGASAIAAVSTVIAVTESEIALSIATIFFYNIAAVLTFPPLGHLLHLGQSAFGVWAGTAINDTSSVVAAGYAYGHEAGAYATIVKLTRAMLILPLVAGVAIVHARRNAAANMQIPWLRIVPWFIAWFLVAACINSSGIFPLKYHDAILTASTFLLSIALGAVGLQTRVRSLLSAGFRPLLFGGILWIAVACVSLISQRATGI